MEKKECKIKGEVIEIREHKNGHLFLTVKDKSGKIQVPIFKNNNINQSKIKQGAIYEITGKVNRYNGELEIIPKDDGDIKESN